MAQTTERLYYSDGYLVEFSARVTGFDRDDPRRVLLDRTAFYPTSGGQPQDKGVLDGIEVIDVIDETEQIVHVLAAPAPEGTDISGRIDWSRRFDHMQQHTGQHLLSAVFADALGIATVSFHMGSDVSTIDLECAALSSDQLRSVEAQANQIVQENRPVRVSIENAEEATALRKATERTGAIRVVTIEALDRSACGGTHVRSTGEIGSILLRSTEKVRGNLRLAFVCGQRAVRRARADYDALDRSARAFSSALDEVPALISATLDRLKDSDKTRRKLEAELFSFRGRALYNETNPNERGLRILERMEEAGPLGDEVRNEANAFISGSRAIYIAVSRTPASLMLAASADANVHCGNVLKAVLAEFGGRGGGAATLAQGTFAGDPAALLVRVREQLARV